MWFVSIFYFSSSFLLFFLFFIHFTHYFVQPHQCIRIVVRFLLNLILFVKIIEKYIEENTSPSFFVLAYFLNTYLVQCTHKSHKIHILNVACMCERDYKPLITASASTKRQNTCVCLFVCFFSFVLCNKLWHVTFFMFIGRKVNQIF